MEMLNIPSAENLYRFLEEHGNDRVKNQLLVFWGMHPRAKFTSHAIGYALDCNKSEANRALKALVDEGIVDTQRRNDLTVYLLTLNEEKRRPVLELARLGWHQRQLMLKHIECSDKPAEIQSESVGKRKENRKEMAIGA